MAILLSKSDIQNLLQMEIAIALVEKAFEELHLGSAIIPLRTAISLPRPDEITFFMPAHLQKSKAIGTKIVAVYKNNVSNFNLPTVSCSITLLDENNGRPLAVMDGEYINYTCIGATSAVATKHLARADSNIGCIFGTGEKARALVWGTCSVVQFHEYFVYSRDPKEVVFAFCKEMSQIFGIPFTSATSPQEALANADIISLATNSSVPVIKSDWIKNGAHINAVGSFTSNAREIDVNTLLASRIIVDQIDAALAESGDFIIPISQGRFSSDMIAADLGAVVCGDVFGRTAPEQITLFKSVGLPILDISAALAAYHAAIEKGFGVEFDFSR